MLLAELIRRQQAEGLNDAEFARKLNVDRTHWIRTCRGERPVGPVILRGALAAYPDLGPMTLAELARRNNGQGQEKAS